MSTLTIELPDDVATQLRAASECRQMTPACLAAELLVQALPSIADEGSEVGDGAAERLMQWCGVSASRVPDLATNPRHLEGLGAD